MSGPGDRPSGANPETSAARIIRRAPTGAFPATFGRSATTGRAPATTHATLDFSPDFSPTRGSEPSPAVPITGCATAIVSGWATSVVATDLIASWWQSNRLFCVAVGFLSLVFAMTTVTGVILLLRQRWLGGQLIAIGALVALLTFGSLFIAGARVPWIVHVIPVVQVASAALALHPATRRWVFRT